MEGLDDVSLANFVKSFKGTCTQCGIYGHNGVDCNKHPSNKDNYAEKQQHAKKQTNQFRGECWYCGILGYKQTNCRKCERALQSKSSAETATLAQGKSNNNHYIFMDNGGEWQ